MQLHSGLADGVGQMVLAGQRQTCQKYIAVVQSQNDKGPNTESEWPVWIKKGTKSVSD